MSGTVYDPTPEEAREEAERALALHLAHQCRLYADRWSEVPPSPWSAPVPDVAKAWEHRLLRRAGVDPRNYSENRAVGGFSGPEATPPAAGPGTGSMGQK